MDHVLVLVGVFAVFVPALLLPGPDFVAVVRTSMSHGTRAGLATTLGVASGLGLYALLSLVGLSALLVQYQWLGWGVRLAGAAYLAYLGIKLLLTRAEPVFLAVAERPAEQRAWLFGFAVTLTNPKAIVLFASVFATAVTPATPVWLMGLMIALVVGLAVAWYALVSVFMSSAPVVARFQRGRHWIERAAGAAFLGLAGKVLADTRHPLAP